MLSKKVIFEGRVQGVGFRYATKQLALGFDVIGTVKNLPEGTVELIIQGEDDEVLEFIDELVDESSVAHHIKKHTIEDIPELESVKGFSIAS
ncbi:acylphosphatase [Rubritalea squalenifaciens DSM 18772]|uniref:acylphosphatase n=1 Tax=Rubritalea squalenifaciens DSM 18772 TaxID=1123071 RepID=A0A1M6H9U2_9BACT|nr:acylphosphatase [Rubritalea squalenifaciens]SHJ18997.1 acylphosphatase [Rubritalea squalenifaciens DSM 18772]